MSLDYQVGAFLDDAPPRYRVTRGAASATCGNARAHAIYGCRGSRNHPQHREEEGPGFDKCVIDNAQARPRTGDAVQRGTWLLCGLGLLCVLVWGWVG